MATLGVNVLSDGCKEIARLGIARPYSSAVHDQLEKSPPLDRDSRVEADMKDVHMWLQRCQLAQMGAKKLSMRVPGTNQ